VILSNFDRIDGNRIAKMKWLNSGLRTAIELSDFEAYYELNLAFHDVFLELSDNVALRRMVEATKQRLYDFPRRGYIRNWEMENCNDHEKLTEALEKGDRDLVKTVWMEGHWSFSVQEQFIRRFYFPDEHPPAFDEPEGGTGREGSWNAHLGERNDPTRSGRTVSGSKSTGRIPS
jgi:hypothetical protein